MVGVQEVLLHNLSTQRWNIVTLLEMLVYLQTIKLSVSVMVNTHGITLPSNNEWPLEMNRKDLAYERLQEDLHVFCT